MSLRKDLGLGEGGMTSLRHMLDGEPVSSHEEAIEKGEELKKLYQQAFGTPAGKKVLDHMFRLTFIDNPVPKGTPIEQVNMMLHQAEGKKALYRSIVALATPEHSIKGNDDE